MAGDRFEFGDFQTPERLARAVASRLAAAGSKPRSVVEPTCGTGTFLRAALDEFPDVERAYGLDVNPDHVRAARARAPDCEIVLGDVFSHDWSKRLATLPEPILIVGNPPWVTSSEMSARRARNVPRKSNARGDRGIDARTGKANFDIAEWIVSRLLDASIGREVTMAVLVKTIVARRVLAHVWRTDRPVHRAAIHGIGAATTACLFVCETDRHAGPKQADVHENLESARAERRIGWDGRHLVADLDAWERTRHLHVPSGHASSPRWRSGVKHDCVRVFELHPVDGGFVNGSDEVVDIESDLIYPLLKGSDVANERPPRRRILVSQRRTNEDTATLRHVAPRTWRYLLRHANALDARRSSIYRGRPRFCIFGIGDYTFAPWKVAIAGLYPSFEFRLVGPHEGRPVLFDDTVYFLPFAREADARLGLSLLRSEIATDFFRSSTFPDAKRPVTAELLNRLDLRHLASEVGLAEAWDEVTQPTRPTMTPATLWG